MLMLRLRNVHHFQPHCCVFSCCNINVQYFYEKPTLPASFFLFVFSQIYQITTSEDGKNFLFLWLLKLVSPLLHIFYFMCEKYSLLFLGGQRLSHNISVIKTFKSFPLSCPVSAEAVSASSVQKKKNFKLHNLKQRHTNHPPNTGSHSGDKLHSFGSSVGSQCRTSRIKAQQHFCNDQAADWHHYAAPHNAAVPPLLCACLKRQT